MRKLPIALASVVWVALIAPVAQARGGLPDLPDYKLMVDVPAQWGLRPGGEDPDDPAAPTGSWTAIPSPIRDGVLGMRVRVAAADVSLPVDPGPAILYTTVGLGGGLGEIGYERLVSVEPTILPPCTGVPCIFESDVSADLRRLPRMAARVRGLTNAWADVGFTLVRTYGDGTWLQELPLGSSGSGAPFSGTLSDPLPTQGRTPPVGLFPAAGATGWREDGRPTDLLDALEDERLVALDTSPPPTTADVHVVATFVGCDYPESGDRAGASLRTVAGDLVDLPRGKGRDFIEVTIRLPTGTSWRVGRAAVEVHPDGTIDAPASTLAIDVDDRPLLVTAAYRCRESGSEPVDVSVAEVIGPSVSPTT